MRPFWWNNQRINPLNERGKRKTARQMRKEEEAKLQEEWEELHAYGEAVKKDFHNRKHEES
jgi:hypothetical protein